jgi:hypothetical protein
MVLLVNTILFGRDVYKSIDKSFYNTNNRLRPLASAVSSCIKTGNTVYQN